MAAKKKPTAKQLAARAKFVKMVRARAAAKKAGKKIAGKKKGAYKKPKLFKPTKSQTKAAAKRLVKQATHKDTKSHNVNIRVVSGVDSIKKDLQKKLFDSQKFASTLVGNIDWYKQMISLDKAKAKYWKVKVSEEKKKLAQLKKNIAILKRAAK